MTEEAEIPVHTLIAAIATGLMVVFIVGFVFQSFFSGTEYKAAESIAAELDSVCNENTGFFTTQTINLPDSKQGLTHREYFYIAISDSGKLLLRARSEATEPITAFINFVTGKPGEVTLKEFLLKDCMKARAQICGQFDANNRVCNNFRFESSEGHEALALTFNRTTDSVVMSYTANP